MTSAVDLVCQALRSKLQREGALSLSDSEWHQLRVSHLMHRVSQGELAVLLADTPFSELLAIANALDVIGRADIADRLRSTTESLAALNEPGRGSERTSTIARLARELDYVLSHTRVDIERHLVNFAFSQPDQNIAVA
jgi:hypothetical protein